MQIAQKRDVIEIILNSDLDSAPQSYPNSVLKVHASIKIFFIQQRY